jgi:MoaA/NifB/PqqE/SkfB family radical SAM enzyme
MATEKTSEWAPITIELDRARHYRRVVTGDANNAQLDIDRILSRAAYPRRLFRGLDDVSLETLKDHLVSARPITIGLRLTNTCNYDCIYCGTAEKRGKDGAGVLTKDEYKDILSQAAEAGVRSAIFGANGEPLLTYGLPEILEHAASLGIVPIIFSNTSVLGNDTLCQRRHGIDGRQLLKVLDESGTSLIISAESLQRERYNRIMAVDAFDYFEEAIRRIRHESSLPEPAIFDGRPLCRLALSAVMMPINYDERHDLVEFIHGLNGVAILKPPSLHGSAATNRDLMFTPDEVKRIRPELEAMSDKQATLQILTLACASWTLSFSIDNEGRFMSCMTEEVNPFGPEVTTRNTRIGDVLGRRYELVKLGNTICPVKDKFYERSSPVAN